MRKKSPDDDLADMSPEDIEDLAQEQSLTETHSKRNFGKTVTEGNKVTLPTKSSA